MSEPRLVIRRQHPHRWRYIFAGTLSAILLLFALGVFAGWYWNMQAPLNRDQYHKLMSEVQEAYLINARLHEQIAILESSEEVARAANRELERTIANLQNQLAGAEGDLSFYKGLARAGGDRPGLAVHQLLITPSGTPGLFHFTLTLAQNLQEAEIIHGDVEFWFEGALDGEMLRLGLDQLLPAHSDELTYEFKYFQVLDGSLMMPANFQPQQVIVRLLPDAKESVTVQADFAWPTVLKRASLNPNQRAYRGAIEP